MPRSRSLPALAGLVVLLGIGFVTVHHLGAAEQSSGSSALPRASTGAAPVAPAVTSDVVVALPATGVVAAAAPAATPALPATLASNTAPTTSTSEAASVAGSSDAAITPWYGKKFNHGPGGGKLIALTFDDGPHPKNTPRVLEILKQEHVTATFFWIGDMVQKNPSVAKMVQAAGHEIGSHTWSHKNLRAISAEAARKEIESAEDIIQQTIGTRPHLFRPPYGNINANVTKIAQDNNLALVLWSVDSNDWKVGTTPEKEIATIETESHPGGVILVHDIQTKTVNSLPRIIAALKAKGFQFVTVSQMMAEANKHPEALSGGGGGAAEEAAPAEPLTIPLDQTK